jgi:hypothetical protein
VRSASFQFSGKASQCTGAEPVVIEVAAYAGNGRAEVQDVQSGSRIAQLSADCSSNPAFARPIDVTALVRQMSVTSGVRHIGFNMRKANNRQGPGLFSLYAGKLTIVLADQAVAEPASAKAPATAGAATAAAGGAAAIRGLPRAAPVAAPPPVAKKQKKTLEDMRTDR